MIVVDPPFGIELSEVCLAAGRPAPVDSSERVWKIRKNFLKGDGATVV